MKKLSGLSIMLVFALRAVCAADGYPPFSWDTVPVYAHLANRSHDFTPEQLAFLAEHFDLITIEKGQAVRKHGSTEEGFTSAAKAIKQRNPKAKVLFYWNSTVQAARPTQGPCPAQWLEIQARLCPRLGLCRSGSR